MWYGEQLERAVEYIENNLKTDIDPDAAASEAAYSLFHFHRLFSLVTGVTPGSYIRRRRLSESAKELVATDRKILDIALDYGFGSHEAYCRAFKRMFNATPLEFRRNGALYGCLERARVLLSPKPLSTEDCMDVRIVRMGKKKLIGMVYYGDNKNGEIPAFWAKHFGRIARLPQRANQCESFGFCFNAEGDDGPNFYYMVAVEATNLDDMPVDMVGKVIPETEYAVFVSKGLANLPRTYEYAYGTWLPASGYRQAQSYDFEYYSERFGDPADPDSEIDIYIPVEKK